MNINDFEIYFQKLNGFTPFPWQTRLTRDIFSMGWPGTIKLPTSSGKTSILDIAIFNMALESNKEAGKRKTPTRIIYVVDRRIVVDEAFERAIKIKDLLEGSRDGILEEVAERLHKIGVNREGAPFDVVKLRGGLPEEGSFIKDPSRPTIIISTVDQVGSRLLFGGYGVSRSMRPIHAALVAVDSMIILDEAHISQPFGQLLSSVEMFQGNRWNNSSFIRPLTFVEMTATPSRSTGRVFTLDDKDEEDKTLNRRITCKKFAKLVEHKAGYTSFNGARESLSKKITSESIALMNSEKERIGIEPVVGVVVNTVLTARLVFEELRKTPGTDCVLLIGRNRPYDRDILVKEYLPRIRADRSPSCNKKPLFVVSTQTIEVGADIDFDALVTEAASLDALRQRFGRLNRLGNKESSKAVIIKQDLGKTISPDPVYGDSVSETWKWLQNSSFDVSGERDKTVDMGIKQVEERLTSEKELEKLRSESPQAPLLLPQHMDSLCQTFPGTIPEPNIPFYLHGVRETPPDVQVVWRGDIPERLEDQDTDYVTKIVASLPPISSEAVALPIWVVRSFLAGSNFNDLTDVEALEPDGQASETGEGRYAIRWNGQEDSELIRGPEISPGDVLVIPSTYGGLDIYGWNPFFNGKVTDIAEEVRELSGRNPCLRVSKNLIKKMLYESASTDEYDETKKTIDEAISSYINNESLDEVSSSLIARLLESSSLKENVRDFFSRFRDNLRVFVYPNPRNPIGFVFMAKNGNEISFEFTDDDDTSSIGNPVTLIEHLKEVSVIASKSAEKLSLPQEIADDLALAAELHDLGKADPRFQSWLRGGEPYSKSDAPLAKSRDLMSGNWDAIEIARKAAGFPRGVRHECYSAKIVMNNGIMLERAHDPNLVIYLIGTHHGRGRPFYRSVQDEGIERLYLDFEGTSLEFNGQHGLDIIGSGWPELFWTLTRKYGYWGLPYLETIVRLADHTASEGWQKRRK